MNDTLRELFEKVRATALVAGSVAEQAFDAAGKKAGELWETTRLTIVAADLQSEIGTMYRDIGALVYKTHIDPATPVDGVDEKLALIDEKQAELHSVRARIAKLKQTRRCPNPDCGRACNRDDQYCRGCGTELGCKQDDCDCDDCDCDDEDCGEDCGDCGDDCCKDCCKDSNKDSNKDSAPNEEGHE